MMVPKTILAAALLAGTVMAAPAAAQATDDNWFVKGGVTRLSLDDDLELNFAGSPVPGAAMDTKPHYTPTLQIGRKLSDHFAVALTVGIPPEIKVQGKGALAPFGELASTTYGPTVLTLQYKPITSGIAQPYIGVGAAYMFVFDVDDGAFQDVEIDEDLSPALEAGIDIMFAENYGIFFDVKKAFLRTETRGTFGGAPVVGRVKLDPWALSTGIVFRF
jgi:outer membrane protein